MLTVEALRGIAAAIEAELASRVDITLHTAPPGQADSVGEAGRVFSSANEQALRAVAQAINALLAQVQQAPVAGPAAPQTGAPAAAPPAPAPAAEAVETIAQEAVVPLAEAAKGGRGLIKVIDPGWGSSGYYSPEVLQRDAPIAFPAGTKMFWDHPTADEAKARPERSLRDLAAETTGPARWDPSGAEGPGVYAPVSVFSRYRDAIEELREHIGVSIRAAAHVRSGEASGKKGPIVERLLPAITNSVDFVTIPGRGGRVAALFEAARGQNDETSEDDDVTEAELRAALAEAQAKATEAEAAKAAAEARATTAEAAVAVVVAERTATEALAKIDLPAVAKEAIRDRVIAQPAMKDGALDVEALRTAVTTEAAKEKAYIDRLTGRGEVRGMGSGAAAGATDPAALEATFKRLGLSEAAAKTAAAGRTQ